FFFLLLCFSYHDDGRRERPFEMTRTHGTMFGELVGKLDSVVVECPKCARTGRYALRRLIEQHGRDGTIIEWLDGLTADCPRKRAASVSDQRHARCPDLPNVV